METRLNVESLLVVYLTACKDLLGADTTDLVKIYKELGDRIKIYQGFDPSYVDKRPRIIQTILEKPSMISNDLLEYLSRITGYDFSKYDDLPPNRVPSVLQSPDFKPCSDFSGATPLVPRSGRRSPPPPPPPLRTTSIRT